MSQNLISVEEAESRKAVAVHTAQHEMAAATLHGAMISITMASGGNMIVSGAALDDALNRFLTDVNSELGPGMAQNAAAHFIKSLAAHLDPHRSAEVINIISRGKTK